MEYMFFNLISGLMFTLVPLIILGTIVYMIYSKVSAHRYNRSQPRLTVKATVVTKRANVGHSGGAGMNDSGAHHTYTSYYVTFQVESGDRMELHVPANEYGMIVEGDQGDLSFQGNEYLGFTRL